ncbi:hypothetical protein OTERR_12730 [Oryzomicrobium terrae]|uniref:Uncharacterized protein n=1 Tax=Oryzomicrobium terrae TaxID=1735038 RepID=A0A5C1E821_9RHOO|nr:hypothetical protein [Oryzomicrobium terrae]QEL64749.1 hypothetical protein OTERR_12730 [Oryzomicrobium terrae]
MNNVHPILREAIAPFALGKASDRRFNVCIKSSGVVVQMTVKAISSRDAVSLATDICFDSDDYMPTEEMEIKVSLATTLGLVAEAA